jgi:serine/threonine protein kinase
MNRPTSSLSSYETVRREISKMLGDELELKSSSERFAPRRFAEVAFSHDRLARFFHSLGFPEASSAGSADIDTLIEITKTERLYAVLAVLVYAAFTKAAVKTAITKIWKNPDRRPPPIVHEWRPGLLPLSEAKCLELFDGDTEQTRRFRDCQPIFCTVVIRKHHPLKLDSPDDWRFPYLEEEELRTGSFGSVFRVKIAANYILEANGASLEQATDVARKDYLLKADVNGQAEYKILDTILNCRSACPHLVESFGSVEWVLKGQPHYSLFMPLAKYDLEAYMTVHEPDGPGPEGIAKKAEMLLGATGLAEGLRWLHYEMKTFDGKRLICYHMDLKPSNVLLFEEPAGTIWKLSDFGMSRVHFVGEPKNVDFDQPFIKRKNRSTPKTRNFRGEGTYLAPETRLATPQSGTESDLWSLGAIVSTLFTYFEFGAKGIEDYETKRVNHQHAGGLDCFFLPPSRDHLVSHRKHPEVEKWHGNLKKIAKKRSEKEGAAVKAILTYVEKSVFVIDSAAREQNTNAGRFVEQLDAAYHAYENFEERTSKDEEKGRRRKRGFLNIFLP